MATTSAPTPPSFATHFNDPLIMEAILSSLITRIRSLESLTQQDPSNDLKNNDHVQIKGQPTTDGHSGDVTPPLSEELNDVDASTDITEPEDSKDVEVAHKILDIVASYGTREKEYPEQPYQAKHRFLPSVLECIKKGAAIKLVLPAFPFKSPNRQNKVLGSLPDLGEEMALANLQSLCDTIRQAYEPGADCYITSDGLVYNDLLGVDDSDVWTYGETLRQMAQDKKLSNVKFLRVSDLLDIAHRKSGGTASHPREAAVTKEDAGPFYLAHASCFRRELVARYQPPGYDADKAIKDDTDTRLTYLGYLRFLKKDLEHKPELNFNQDGKPISPKKTQKMISVIAKCMLARGAAFAAAIRDTHGDCVRLSIHPTVAVTKFPVNLIPQPSGEFGPTPWHASTALNVDGSFETGHSEDLKKTHDLIYRDGKPYYFREKSDLFNWGDLEVEFEPLYPCGLIIRPASGSPSARLIPMEKVRKLSVSLSPVILRGFSETLEEDVYVEKGHEAGKILPWTFGIIQKVKDAGNNTKMGNNVTSNEAMPMHFDGMFKFEDREDPVTGEITKVQAPPGFQFFTAPAVAPEGTGYTLFASSRLFFNYLRSPYNVERFEKIHWNMDNDGFWDAKCKDLSLVVRHPVTNAPCLRWHEPWDETKTKFSTCVVTLTNDDQEIVDVVTKLLYDYRVCLRFTWHVGDWLVSDNTSMLHTRTGYTTGCDRELWRIHFD